MAIGLAEAGADVVGIGYRAGPYQAQAVIEGLGRKFLEIQADLSSIHPIAGIVEKAVATLKFDMVASWFIFCEKGDDFFEWVDSTHAAIVEARDSGYTEEEEEILHLKILKDYYINLGLVNNFTEAEMHWFNGFQEAKVV